MSELNRKVDIRDSTRDGTAETVYHQLMQKIQDIPLVPDVLLRGRWTGYADTIVDEGEILYLPDGYTYTVPQRKMYRADLKTDFVIRNGHIRGAVAMTLDLKSIGGEGEYWIFGTVHGKMAEADHILLHFENAQEANHFGEISLRPSKDWECLAGDFYFFQALFSRKPESGTVYLERVEESETTRPASPSPVFPVKAETIIGPQWGEDASEFIRDAESIIKITHFSKEQPSEQYLATLEEKLENNVQVTRIVYRHKGISYDWLQRFRQPDGNLKPGYTEYTYEGKNIAQDLAIVDDQKVLIALPGHQDMPHFTNSLVISGVRLSFAYQIIFSQLLQDSKATEEMGGTPALLPFKPSQR